MGAGPVGGPSDLTVLSGTDELLRGAWGWRRIAEEAVAWFELHLV